ncbi:MAG: hypothetical protein M1275_03655 [Patescibacteria group bacterium]|nr:hypothetical protein [Patescibacteria group bacterium]
MRLTLGPNDYILLVNLNSSAFSLAVRNDPAHFRFVKLEAIRTGYTIADGCRQMVLFKTSREQNDILRVAAPGVSQKFVTSNGQATEFLTNVVTQTDGDGTPAPPGPTNRPAGKPHFGSQSSGVDFDAAAGQGEPQPPPDNQPPDTPPPPPPADSPKPPSPTAPMTLRDFAQSHQAEIASMGDFAAGKELAKLAVAENFHGSAGSFYGVVRAMRGNPLPTMTERKKRGNPHHSPTAEVQAIALDPELAEEVESIMVLNRDTYTRLEKILPQIRTALAIAGSVENLRKRVTSLETANHELSERLQRQRELLLRLAEE